jgi:TfoX/Sxy family transcriptional regulator of competence genes
VPYDEELADRIRVLLDDAFDVDERRMFGGLAFLAGGVMVVAASRDGGLMVRVDPAETEALLGLEGVEPFEMRGRPLGGWVRVAPEAVDTRDELEAWVQRALAYARSLPPKD